MVAGWCRRGARPPPHIGLSAPHLRASRRSRTLTMMIYELPKIGRWLTPLVCVAVVSSCDKDTDSAHGTSAATVSVAESAKPDRLAPSPKSSAQATASATAPDDGLVPYTSKSIPITVRMPAGLAHKKSGDGDYWHGKTAEGRKVHCQSRRQLQFGVATTEAAALRELTPGGGYGNKPVWKKQVDEHTWMLQLAKAKSAAGFISEVYVGLYTTLPDGKPMVINCGGSKLDEALVRKMVESVRPTGNPE